MGIKGFEKEMFTNSNFIFNYCKINLLFVNMCKLKVKKLITKCLRFLNTNSTNTFTNFHES
ncbi:hypothetical protein B0A69_10020 [Chryseobacterium shigense]|nr:hypothetical protein B0A69_10020 [Chryseobacterium shigense]